MSITSDNIEKLSKPDIIRAGFNIASQLKFIPGVQLNKLLNANVSPQKNFKDSISPPGIPSAVQRELYKSAIGTPVVIDLQINAASYTKAGVNYNFSDINLTAVLVTLNQTKNIVKTPIQGLDGTIKEYISDGDWQVNIRGVILGQNGVYPLQEVTELKTAADMALDDAGNVLKVNSWFLQIFGIDNLVVESATYPQEEGGISMQLFEWNCISDKSIELQIS